MDECCVPDGLVEATRAKRAALIVSCATAELRPKWNKGRLLKPTLRNKSGCPPIAVTGEVT
jgi:hypothetical protein